MALLISTEWNLAEWVRVTYEESGLQILFLPTDDAWTILHLIQDRAIEIWQDHLEEFCRESA